MFIRTDAENIAPDFYYTVGNNTENSWSHFEVVTHGKHTTKTLCGEIRYKVDIDMRIMDLVTYDEEAREFTIFTDERLIANYGPFTYTVNADLADYPA
jgi:hypothetical protein